MSKNTVTPAPATAAESAVETLLTTHAETPGARRKALRDSWSVAMRDAFMDGDHDAAKVYATALKEAEAQTVARKSVATEIDWRQITADRVAALREAADLIESGRIRPTGTPDDVSLDELPAPNNPAEASVKLASMRLAGTRNVPEFISERVADLGEGAHTASDLVRGQIDAPSTGAIGAVYVKMTKGFEVAGIVATRNEKGTAAFAAE